MNSPKYKHSESIKQNFRLPHSVLSNFESEKGKSLKTWLKKDIICLVHETRWHIKLLVKRSGKTCKQFVLIECYKILLRENKTLL